jgi:hypothetical protein
VKAPHQQSTPLCHKGSCIRKQPSGRATSVTRKHACAPELICYGSFSFAYHLFVTRSTPRNQAKAGTNTTHSIARRPPLTHRLCSHCEAYHTASKHDTPSQPLLEQGTWAYTACTTQHPGAIPSCGMGRRNSTHNCASPLKHAQGMETTNNTSQCQPQLLREVTDCGSGRP